MDRPPTFPEKAKKVFQGEIFSVWQWPQKRFDGSTKIYERISRTDSVYTLGILPDNKILIVKDEQPDRKAVLTPAGGQVDEGESPSEAARREFFEETGYEIGRLTSWYKYQPHLRMNSLVHAFIGRDLKRVNSPQNSAGEKITLVSLDFEEFLLLGKNTDLRDRELRINLLQAILDPDRKEELKKIFYG